MNFIKRNRAYFIAPAIVLLILSVVFAIKGVYPFGSRTVAYYDMPLCYVPLYTHAYDVIHGNAPAMLDWFNAASCDFTLNFINYIFNPFTLLLFFTKRDNIICFMSIIMMIKLALSSYTMALYIKKKHSAGDFNTVVSSLLYAFCGFSLSDSVNIFFLDIHILFPLIMLSLEHMIKTGKALPYVIVTFAAMTISSYLSAMAYIYVILYVFGYCLFIEKNNDKRRRIIAGLGIYTIIAMLITAGVVLPSLTRTLTSPRTAYNHSFDEILAIRTSKFDEQKLFMLFGSEFAIAVLILSVIKCIRGKQKPDSQLKFNIYCMILLAIPLISEGSNLIWHFGSYVHFPYRFGYILAFTSVNILAGFNNEHNSEKPYFRIRNPKLARFAEYSAIFASISSIIVFGIIAYLLKDKALLDYFSSENATIRTYRVVLVFMIVSGILIFGLCNKKMRAVLMALTVVIQSSLGCFGFIAPKNPADSEYVKVSSSVYDELELKHDNISRIKSRDIETQILNFPLLSGYSGLTDWTLCPTAEYMNEMKALGYNCPYTQCYDYSGTYFSDALLNVKMMYAFEKVDDTDFYKFRQQIQSLYFYDCNYTLPFGMLADSDLSALPEASGKSPFELQNDLFRAFFDNEDLFTYYSLADADYEQTIDLMSSLFLPYYHTFSIDIKGSAIIYAYSANKDLAYSYTINNKTVSANESSELAEQNSKSVISAYQEIINIGNFKDETVELTINTNISNINDLYIGVLDLAKLSEICEKYSAGNHAYDVKADGTEMTMKVDDPDGRWLFLPIEYNPKWKATINGSNAEITPVMGGAFIGIKLGSEDADIKLRYDWTTQYRCLIITVIGILLLAAVLYMNKKGHRLADVKAIGNAAAVVFTATSYGIMIILFAAPVLGNIISLIISKFI